MKNLYDYIQEGILDNADTAIKDMDKNIHINIIQYIISNYRADKNKITIRNTLNNDGKYIVDYNGDIEVTNKFNISLTNDDFVFGTINGRFGCQQMVNIKDLIGSPEIVNGDFDCWGCTKLKSLKGAPKIIKNNFECDGCNNIKKLDCSIEEIHGKFSCNDCRKLISLEGAPKIVYGDFWCSRCGKRFKADDVKSIVKGTIFT